MKVFQDLRTAIDEWEKSRDTILKIAGKVITTTVKTTAQIVDNLTGGRAGQTVNALKNKGKQIVTSVKDSTSAILKKLNTKNWTIPKLRQPGWMKKATSAVSSKVSGATQWVKGIPAKTKAMWDDVAGKFKGMIDEAFKKGRDKNANGGRIGRKFGTPNPRKTNVQKIKETFGPKKKLSPKQMKIAKLAGNPNKIDGADFKKLHQ